MSFLKKNLIALIALFISIAIPIWQHFYDNTKVIREHKYEVLPTIKDIFSKYSLYGIVTTRLYTTKCSL